MSQTDWGGSAWTACRTQGGSPERPRPPATITSGHHEVSAVRMELIPHCPLGSEAQDNPKENPVLSW